MSPLQAILFLVIVLFEALSLYHSILHKQKEEDLKKRNQPSEKRSQPVTGFCQKNSRYGTASERSHCIFQNA